MCDWPENAHCNGGGGGGGGGGGYDHYGEDYAYYDDDDDDDDGDYGGDDSDDTYPYQPGTSAPKYYEDEDYYTEAPRATMAAPVYRWV